MWGAEVLEERAGLVRSTKGCCSKTGWGRHCGVGGGAQCPWGLGGMSSSPPSRHSALAPAIDWILIISTFPGEINVKKQEGERGHDVP